MATSTSTLANTVAQALAAARDNEAIQELVAKNLSRRKMAVVAAKVGTAGARSASRRRAARKATLAGEPVAIVPIVESSNGNASSGKAKGKKSKSTGIGIGKIALIATVIGVVVLVTNKGARGKALDTLFGAEEEFHYQSTTTASTNGSR
ncbi:MAG: hypothetical protein JHC87_08505 [Thermoleophilaceae bacterium]|nr:hypothetical protein [Thermoleophilaceae bacterium]